jgi:hypothetical protein
MVAGEQLLDEGAIGGPLGRGRHSDLHSPGCDLESQLDPADIPDSTTIRRATARQVAVTAPNPPL